MSSESSVKHSYTVPCSTAFREQVEALAARRRVNVADLARSVLLVVPEMTVAAWDDPGEPPADDREQVILKTGAAQGRPWKRKPRLQVRLPLGYSNELIRKALSMALSMYCGRLPLYLGDRPEPPAPEPPPAPTHVVNHSALLDEINEEVERLRILIGVLAFEPLTGGVRTREEALHVMGFPPASAPDSRTLKAKFRMLATIHHPDSRYGNHVRMSQLNQAMELLRS